MSRRAKKPAAAPSGPPRSVAPLSQRGAAAPSPAPVSSGPPSATDPTLPSVRTARLKPITVPAQSSEAPPLSRRHWLVAAGGLAGLLAGFWPTRAVARIRPPGALPPGAFERACIRCFRCAEVCPTKAIRFDSALDPRSSDTPYLILQDRPCVLCMKCTEVCPTHALVPTDADPAIVQEKIRMGRPVLDKDKCLPWTGGGVCRLCYYACPYPDEAITLGGPRQAPDFHADACVGCGLCEEACPGSVLAIRIEPGEVSA